ncbi:uncharacterized protein ALTATR162_LOCUS12001 [Alternaria atra]|uniref:Heterokaryon incompatibility domain-containing protein n=1 Tax=Alternaria atra TaxID=119953 RepID=A0A8J2IE75_9PLEO|nr:uncharacterized protein ALTATR162_LOCUS12001 [Alternaria atra]CAG5188642.1 unnamed protein product [Alternaria atra]
MRHPEFGKKQILTQAGDDLGRGLNDCRPISLDPLSDRTIIDVREWMKKCEDERDGSHKICSLSEDAFVPTRVIKIIASEQGLHLRLIRGKDIEEHDTSGFMALSYCWGGDQPKQLMRNNLDSYKTDIPWKTLPKTLQDAATTAQALGFHYVWVDSMCIIQDSEEDKAVEISQMTQVYAHARLTVMARRGGRVTDGFLHSRALPSGTSSIKLQTNDGQTQRIILTFRAALEEEENLALNTRGWTMQEHILSRHLLIIGTWVTE